jgi:hypothetical protein
MVWSRSGRHHTAIRSKLAYCPLKGFRGLSGGRGGGGGQEDVAYGVLPFDLQGICGSCVIRSMACKYPISASLSRSMLLWLGDDRSTGKHGAFSFPNGKFLVATRARLRRSTSVSSPRKVRNRTMSRAYSCLLSTQAGCYQLTLFSPAR